MKRFTVNQVARLSGVTVRTLHFYDEIGLLKPAYKGENGYRYYEKAQLLTLQQILFYRELNVPLEQIRAIMTTPAFDRLAALKAHRARLENEVKRHRQLIRTIDGTIAELEGAKTMANEQIFEGFAPEKQKEYEDYLVDRFGPGVQAKIDDSKRRMKGWTKADFEASGKRWQGTLEGLGALARAGRKADSAEVQSLIAGHHEWLRQFWTPNRESYTGLGRLYADHPDFRSQFDAVEQGLADFMAEAMRVYADRELN